MDSAAPQQEPPLPCDKLVSWQWRGNIFIHGGYGAGPRLESDIEEALSTGLIAGEDDHSLFNGFYWNRQLAMFDPSSGCWSFPETTGTAPSARAAHAAVVCRDCAYVFGGRLRGKRLNDLYRLDLTKMQWTCLLDSHDDEVSRLLSVPVGRSWHSLTLAESDVAALYGGYSTDHEALSDCWRLDLRLADERRPECWTRCEGQERTNRHRRRLWHQAFRDPFTGRVCVLGGLSEDIHKLKEDAMGDPNFDKSGSNADAPVLLTVAPLRLKILALETMVKVGKTLTESEEDSVLDNLPLVLQHEYRVLSKQNLSKIN